MATPSNISGLSRELCTALWARIVERLNAGEVLVSNQHFQLAIEEAYLDLVGTEAPSETTQSIRRMIVEVNKKHPETFVALGVKNAMTRAFEEGVRKLNWDVAKIQEKGARSIFRFSRMDEILDLLAAANIKPEEIDVIDCVKRVIQGLKSKSPKPPPPVPAAPRVAAPPPVAVASEGVKSLVSAAAMQEAILTGEVEREELAQRTKEQKGRAAKVENQEFKKVPENISNYIERGLVTEGEGEKIKALHEVDAQLKKGEIGEEEASRVRNSILSGSARDALERPVKEAVADSVRYIQVFDSMKRIDPQLDNALGFLIRHKEAVMGTTNSSDHLKAAIEGMLESVSVLNDLIDIMERKDHEIRMISVRLPPYNFIMGRGLEKIGNLTIEEAYIEDLRNLSGDDISERLNSPDQMIRVRPAADMRCFVSLIDHVSKKTPFRKEIRTLRISKNLEDFFRTTTDLKEARHQAEDFLNRRLKRLFPDMTADETAEIQQRGAKMIDNIEQQVIEDRQAAVEAERQKRAEAAEKPKQEKGGEGDDMELSEDERNLGVQIGRVEMRVAGNTRRVPYKVMPDPDNMETYVIVQRDPDTGELVPQRRRGSKRVVEKDREGIWHVV